MFNCVIGCMLYTQRWASKLCFKSPQSPNPQILGLISLSQTRKFLRRSSRQIENPQIFMLNPKNAVCYICKEKKYVFADLQKSAKDCISKSQIREVRYLRKVGKSNKSQIFGIAICGTYLRTAQLCVYVILGSSVFYRSPK
jgi:hypothetical protein